MPFSPANFEKFSDKYLINPKNTESPHMTVGFETTNLGYKNESKTVTLLTKLLEHKFRKKHNPQLYELISEFHKLTGVAALLNTSFNLHGFPIVNTSEQAISVLIKSDLDGLLLNNFFYFKKINMNFILTRLWRYLNIYFLKI